MSLSMATQYTSLNYMISDIKSAICGVLTSSRDMTEHTFINQSLTGRVMNYRNLQNLGKLKHLMENVSIGQNTSVLTSSSW